MRNIIHLHLREAQWWPKVCAWNLFSCSKEKYIYEDTQSRSVVAWSTVRSCQHTSSPRACAHGQIHLQDVHVTREYALLFFCCFSFNLFPIQFRVYPFFYSDFFLRDVYKMRVYGHPCCDLIKHITDLDSHGTDRQSTVSTRPAVTLYRSPVAHRRPLQLRTADLFGVHFSSLTARQ
jgi:hypothetical protein